MLAGIREFVIITTPAEQEKVRDLFSRSEEYLGVTIRTLVQPEPLGIADAFRVVHQALGESVNDYDITALILGDNIFYGTGFTGIVHSVDVTSATVFAYTSQNPSAFGVVELRDGKAISLEEKPEHPKSNLIVTGLYFYPRDVYTKVYQLTPSVRGELEITDLNKLYLEEGRLSVVPLYRGMVWFDTGTPESMLEAANFIYNVQRHQGFMVGNPHEIAIKNRWATNIHPFISMCSKTPYGKYLQNMLEAAL